MSLLAAGQFGNITNPFVPLGGPANLTNSTSGSGMIIILNNLVRFIIVIAALYTFLNLIFAGYGFLSAGGDPKKVAAAWEKIWQSLIGLLIIAGSFVLAGIFGWLIFGNVTILISPRLFTP